MAFDTSSIVAIIVAIVAIYLFIKFIVSPIIRAVLGIIIFLIVIYLLQKFLGFNLDQILAPFGISLNADKWGINVNSILGIAGNYIEQIKGYLNFIGIHIPKSVK